MSPVAARPHRSATWTSNACAAVRPAASRAVTVTAAAPGPTAVTVSSEPATDTAATAGAELSAENVIPVSSSSAKCGATSSIRFASSTPSTCGGIEPTARGARFTGGAASPAPGPLRFALPPGPCTVTDGEFDSTRPSAVHTAREPPQVPRDTTLSVSGASEDGDTVIAHRSLRPLTRFAFLTLPATAVTALFSSVR